MQEAEREDCTTAEQVPGGRRVEDDEPSSCVTLPRFGEKRTAADSGKNRVRCCCEKEVEVGVVTGGPVAPHGKVRSG